MSFTEEVIPFLAKWGVEDRLPPEEKSSILDRVLSSLPIDLGLMSSYDESATGVDIDVWNQGVASIRDAGARLPDEPVLVYLKAWPRSYLLKTSPARFLDLILDPKFYAPFAVFSLDETEYLIQDHSGSVIGSGRFEGLIDAVR